MQVQTTPAWHLLQACAWLALTACFAHAQTTPTTTTISGSQAQQASRPASPSSAERKLKKHPPTGRAGRYFTPGWSLMSPEERKEHQEHMSNIKSQEECKSYLEQHHEKMVTRAKEKDAKLLAKPWRDACGAFQKK